MARRSRYAGPAEHRWVTLPQMAREIDRTHAQTTHLLVKAQQLGYLRPRRRIGKHRVTLYPASHLEVLKAMVGVPHRPVPTQDGDWLSDYERKT